MDQNEGSVMSSLKQLMLEEDQRRAEQISLAQRRKLMQDREMLEEQGQRAEQERRLAEQAKREAIQRADEKRVEQERLERERHADLERVRAELELRAKTAVMKLEQQHALERLTVERDVRVRQLESHRTILAALLGTLLMGAPTLYGFLLHPELRRQEQTVTNLSEANAMQRTEHQRERDDMTTRIGELQTRLADVQSKLDAEQKKPPTKEPKLIDYRDVTRPPRPPVLPHTTRCDDHDPLCGDIGKM